MIDTTVLTPDLSCSRDAYGGDRGLAYGLVVYRGTMGELSGSIGIVGKSDMGRIRMFIIMRNKE